MSPNNENLSKGQRQESDGAVQVVLKASALLDCLAEAGELSAADISDAIGEPRSSVYRLLSTLVQVEMVEPAEKRGNYRLGFRLLRLGTAVTENLDLRNRAFPTIERIHSETGETVFLCVRRDRQAVCIERLAGRKVQALALQLGGMLPLHTGAAPKTLLAFEPEAFWHDYAETEQLERLTPGTLVSPEELFSELSEIRELGYATSDGDVTVGIAALGAPVFDHQAKVAAALSISGVRPSLMEDGRRERMIELISEGAAEISHALGFNRGEVKNVS